MLPSRNATTVLGAIAIPESPPAATGIGRAEIIEVFPGGSIQAAIDASSNGDEIIAHPGTYPGQIILNGNAITP